MDTTAEATTTAKPKKAKPRPEDMTPTERANLAAFMNPEYLKQLGTKTVTKRNRDLASRSERMKQLARLQKMYALTAEKKNFPWQHCANIKTPSLTGPNLQIQARLYDMIWPANGKVFNVVPANVQVQPFAHTSEQFANAYVRYKMPYMAQGLDDTLHQMCLYGSAFRRTYWDSAEGKVRSDWVPLEDFVVAYRQRSQDPSMSDVPRYTMTHHLSMYDLRADTGKYVQVDLIDAKKRGQGDGETETSEFQATADKVDGVTPGEEDEDEDAVRPVLEQHCTLRMLNKPDKHPSFDGREHKVVITVDAWTDTVLRVSLREEDDPDDKRRFDRQKAAHDKYLSDLATYEASLTAPPMLGGMDMSIPPDPMMGPPDMSMPVEPTMAQAPVGPMMDPMMMESPAPLMPPMAPEPVDEPLPIRKRQICFFTHYRCFPSDGFYGLGYGDLLYGLTLAENTIINQMVDGQAVKNAKPMFMSKQGRMARGAINIGPGQVNEIDVPMGSIKDAIMFLDPPNSDPGTVPLIKMLEGMRDTIAGNGDLMSGQAPGSNQTKGGMQILNEQMMAPITVLARRTKDAFSHELYKIWRCWGVYLEDEEVVDVIGENGQPQEMKIGKWMFAPGVHLVPASDPRMKSQRMEDLQTLTSFVMSMPNIMQNPAVGGPVLTKLCKMVLSVFPDGDQLIPLLEPPPPPPPQPKEQLEENAGFMRGQDSPVHPADDDDQHLSEIEMFMTGPDAGALDTKGKLMVQNHARGHVASRMQKRGQQLGQQGNAFGPQAGGPIGMAPGPGFGPPAGAPPA